MARPFAFNPSGATISGCIQVGDIAVGVEAQDYFTQPGGVHWWNGPDESLGYIIAKTVPSGNQPNSINRITGNGQTASIGFNRSEVKTEESFLNLVKILYDQTFVDGDDAKDWLEANGYWTSYIKDTPYILLDTIATYLRDYMSDFRNPSFYNYQLDGDGYYISDGGGDMYDGGNFTTPALLSGQLYVSSGSSIGQFPYAIDYTDTTRTDVDTSFGYVSLGYTQFTGVQDPTYLPLTVLGARNNTDFGTGLPVGWQVGGNSGADGGGVLASGWIYNNQTSNGFTCYAWYRQTYSAGDPSHCNVYMLLGHSNWDSNFGATVSAFADGVGGGGCGGYLFATGSNVNGLLAVQTLLSKNSGQQVTAAEIKNVVDNFTLRIGQSIGY